MTTTYYGTGVCLPIDAGSGSTPTYAAEDTRDAFSALFWPTSGRPLGARSGIRPGNDPALSVDASGNWTVQPFACIVDPGTAAGVGAYLVAFQTAITGSLNPADGTYERIDRIDIQVPDDPIGTSPANARLAYTPGTPSASPSAPSAAPRSTSLATFTVPAVSQGSPAVSGNWKYTVASGGVVPMVNAGDRPFAYRGAYIDDPAAGLLRYDGTKWTPYVNGDTGLVTAGIATAASGGTLTGQSARMVGNLVSLDLSGTTPAASSGGTSDGDYGNMVVATLTSAWRPAHGKGLASGSPGAHFGFYLNADGTLQITSGPPGGFAKGVAWSVSGMYFID